MDALGTDRTLYPFGLPGHHGRETELEAALATRGRAKRLRERVLEVLRERGDRGLTYPEAQEVLGQASAQQRLSDLVQRGLAVDSGRRRPTPRGSAATVWILSEQHGSSR